LWKAIQPLKLLKGWKIMADRGNLLLRRADFLIGIPLVLILGLFRLKKRPLPDNNRIKKIGVLATAAIGDTILLSSVLKDIKGAYPKAEMTLFTGGTNKAISGMICPQDKLITLEVSRPDQSVRQIRKEGYFDLWIDCGPWPRINSVLTAFSKTRCAIGFRTPGQFRHYVYDRTAFHSKEQHEMDNLRDLAQAAGVVSRSQPSMEPQWSADKSGDYTVIHMIPGGYMSHFKEWSPDNWTVLINSLNSAGHKVVLTGAPGDKNKTDNVVASCAHRELLEDKAGALSLKELPSLLAGARLVISVNTGIMHMAAALNCPLIALHGPTSVKRWGPVSDRAINFEATSSSAGCLDLGFEYDKKDPRSMDTISPGIVAQEALRILEDTI
jgi:heptosyltransferase I